MAIGCGAKCAKFLLIVFNIIFWLSGCALMALGILLILDKDNKVLLDLLDIGDQEPLLRIAAYFFIGVGAFVFIVGFFGCCGAVQEMKGCLITYFLLLIIILAAEVAAAVLAIVYKSDLEKSLKKSLEDSVKMKYDGDPTNSVTNFWDNAQRQFACCGVDHPDVYKYSPWYNKTNLGKGSAVGGTFMETQAGQAVQGIEAAVSGPEREVPLSCCKLALDSTPDDVDLKYLNEAACQGTATAGHEAARNQEGCYGEVERWFKENSTLIIGVGIGIGCLEIFGMIFAMCLCRNLSSDM